MPGFKPFSFTRAVLTMLSLGLVSMPSAARAQTPQTAPAQSGSPHEGIGVGVMGGPLFSSLVPVVSDNHFSNKTGFIGGLFLRSRRPGVVGLDVDVLYTQRGAKDPDSDLSFTIDYLEVPVLLRLNSGASNSKGANFYGVVGPSFGFRLKSTLSTGDSLTDDIAGADVGLSVGAGVEMTRFLIEGRFTRGFRNVATPALNPGEVLKSRTFAILFGFKFN